MRPTEVFNPHHGQPLDATQRLSMSPARRARILALFDNKCWRCGSTENLEIDHAIVLELGGDDADPNLIVLCHADHLAKTALDRKMIAKAARLRRAQSPDTRKTTKRPLKSRGFYKGPKRRKLSGEVADR